jgi:M6 family metalloprotease-like protein
MRKSLKLTILALCVALCALLFTLTALAVPTPQGGGCKSHPGPLVTLSDIAGTAARRNRGPMRAPSFDPAVSDLPLAVIVVGFSDMPYRDDFDWSQEVFRSETSLATFYTDMSFGQFTFTPVFETSAGGVDGNTNTADAVNDGVIHVTLPTAHDDWTLEYPYMSRKDIATNRSLTEALIAAVNAADGSVDFAAYDTDGNGEITTDELALGFVFAGYEAASSAGYKSGKNLYLWSHAWSLQEAKDDYDFTYTLPSPDGVTVNSYIAISEQEEDKTQAPISVMAHELGHYLGLPDLYDTDYTTSLEWSKYQIGSLSLMNVDCWETEDGVYLPTPLDAWSRVVLGWVTPETAASTGEYTVTAQDYADNTGYALLRIDTQNPGEYYLLENRVPAGWDSFLTQEFDTEAGGVIFWHIDDGVMEEYFDDNTVNNADHRPAVMPVFPEKNSAGAYAFTGVNKQVLTDAPFFDRAVWNGDFAALGETFDLPLYGTGDSADLRSGRTNSGIQVKFLTDAGAEMRVALNPESHVHHPVLTVVQAPTCTAAGTGYYECPLCGKRFTDETGATETDGTVTLAALGHTAPDGNGKCTRCGEMAVSADQLCPYCHGYHNGTFIQRIVAFFHQILYFFSHLFGRS